MLRTREGVMGSLSWMVEEEAAWGVFSAERVGVEVVKIDVGVCRVCVEWRRAL